MPQYHIFSRPKGSGSIYTAIGIISGDGARNAWNSFKGWAKREKYTIDPLLEYQIYPINHCRIWENKNGKWTINSFYGNHDARKYRAQLSARMRAAHKNKYHIDNETKD